MSMNGITGYSAYPYSNPYAIPTSNTNTTFQGTAQAYTNQTEEKNNTGLAIAGIGAAALAIGTGIYALKKGKSINGADGKLLENLKTGFQEIGKTISESVKSLFKGKNLKKTEEVVGEKELKNIKNSWDAKIIQEQIDEFGPEGTRHQQRIADGYEEMINKLFSEAE